jgi:hypothetical protein
MPEGKSVLVTGLSDDKLTAIIHGNFPDYSGVEDRLKGYDACYRCLGVSRVKVRKEEDYQRITHDFTIKAPWRMHK